MPKILHASVKVRLGFCALLRLFPIAFLLAVLSPAATGHADSCGLESFEGRVVAEVRFSGLVHTKNDVINRAVAHRRGTPFDCGLWAEEQKTLLGYDLFSEVKLIPEETNAGLRLIYQFTELRQFVWFPAMKATDLNGLMLGGGGAALNLFGQDVRLDGYVRSSVVPLFNANEFMLWATSPWMGPWPLGWELLLTGIDALNPGKDFHERSYALELDVYQKSMHPFNILTTVDFIAVRHDENKRYFTPDEQTALPFFLSETGWDFVPKVGLALIWDARDRLANPQSGQYLELRGSQFGGPLGGPANYQEWLLDYRGYWQLHPRHFFQTTSLGQYRPGTMGAYDLFHVGGTNSVRGYVMRPTQYGQHEWINTMEYRYVAIPQQSFALWDDNFYSGLHLVGGADVAWMWRDDASPPYLMPTIYGGFHVLFPFVERVRVEFGIGDLHRGPQNLVWAVTLGFFEKSFMQRERTR